LAPAERLLCLWITFFVWYGRRLTEALCGVQGD
jgi:hypothetical protein